MADHLYRREFLAAETHSCTHVRGRRVCGKVEEAINFYVSVFKGAPDGAKGGNTKADILARYGRSAEPDEFGAMDSGREHNFAFNEAISFIVPCDTQEEIDYFWRKLSAEPQAEQRGSATCRCPPYRVPGHIHSRA